MADRDRGRGRFNKPTSRSRSRSGDRDRGYSRQDTGLRRTESLRHVDDRGNRQSFGDSRGNLEQDSNRGGFSGIRGDRGGHDSNRGAFSNQTYREDRGRFSSSSSVQDDDKGRFSGPNTGRDRGSTSSYGDRSRLSSSSSMRDNERSGNTREQGGERSYRDRSPIDNRSSQDAYNSDRGSYGNRGGYGGDRGGRGGYGGDRGGRGGYGGDRGGRGGYGGDRGGRGGYGGGRGGRGGGRGGGGDHEPEVLPPKVEIWSNYFELLSHPNWHLFQYHVYFEPPIESRRLKYALIKSVIPSESAFDGSTLFTLKELTKDEVNVKVTNKRDERAYELSIKKVADIYPTPERFLINQIAPNELYEVENPDRPKKDKTTDFLRFLNLIFKKCLKHCGLVEYGRDRACYDFRRPIKMAEYRLNVVNGYKASIDIYTNKLLLCTELASRLINEETVLECINRLYNNARGNREKVKELCIHEVVGQTVLTMYNNRSYKVDDIAWDMDPTYTFETKKGKISMIDYYAEIYGKKINDKKQPLLISNPSAKDRRGGRKDPIYLIPEFCSITGGNVLTQFKTNFNFKRDLAGITQLGCQQRYDRLVSVVNTVRTEPTAHDELNKWAIEFSRDVVKFETQVLARNEILFKNNSCFAQSNGWNNHLKNAAHISAPHLHNWIIIVTRQDEDKCNEVINELIFLGAPMGFRVDKPYVQKLGGTEGKNYAGPFVQAIKSLLGSGKERPQMIVCLTPGNAPDAYHAIKKLCCIEYGVPSQVLTANTLKKNLRSVITKVAIQMSCKLGGEVWGLQIPLKSVMVVGIDVYTDTSDSKKRTVTAFVSSMNANVGLPGFTDKPKTTAFTRWYSRCMMESKEQKYSDWLHIMMTGALDKYHSINGSYPDRIFVYRDGVSDHQFGLLKEFEIEPMKEACKQLDPTWNPKITVIVVQKRSNARFFMKGERDLVNPYVGTVIDSTVVKSEDDFYLISQSTNQGTVNPTHYHVIDGAEHLSKDRIQSLTYKLTHMYYNWPGHIRVPAPCHYAHKLAFLVANSLHQTHNPSLDELLFYL